jgi:hypothetical protein
VTEIVAADNPALANQIIDKVLAGVETASEVRASELGVAFTDLPDTHVELPGGFLTSDGVVTRSAEVRELTGFDEEALAKAGTAGKVMSSLLTRGVVKVGDEKPTQDTFNSLLAGDRDTLLLAIRRVTYGSEVEFQLMCPECGEVVDIKIDLANDVKYKRLDDDSERRFNVSLRHSTALVALPNGSAQRALLQAEDKTFAELNTILLRHCVLEVDDFPVVSEDSVRKLSIKDRETILDELAKRSPGPDLSGVKKACPSCEEDINIPLTLSGLFRF